MSAAITPGQARTPTVAHTNSSAQMQLDGNFIQGGWMRGTAPVSAVSVQLDGQDLAIDASKQFFAAFDRDAEPAAALTVTYGDGRTEQKALGIAARKWRIEHVNVARRKGGASEAWWKKREPEWNAIQGARAKITGADGWRQDFIWPVKGRISGRFGSQRVYRGEPGSYHSGLDIAPGAGKPFVAPADGVVVLAVRGFSLEGNLLIVDHGNGLNSAFLHAQSIAVAEGDAVKQGQLLGRVGSSGRATGPHLHWSLKWRDARLDPLLFLPDAG
ncbi:MAG: M23 family metallopeptidase [Erythrobacter sp.]